MPNKLLQKEKAFNNFYLKHSIFKAIVTIILHYKLLLMQQEYVNYTVENGVVSIEFFTPQHNSLPSFILKKIAQSIDNAALDDSIKTVILKSGSTNALLEKETFCAGASFNELIAIENEVDGLSFFSGFAQVINAMRKCPKFIIAQVQGKAIGGGVGLICACDYAIATKYASVKLSELAVGIGPFVVGPAVERKIGTSAAYELAIDASNFRTASWAMQKGMYAEVVETIEELNHKTTALAKNLSTQSAEAMAAIKHAFWQGTEHWDTLLTSRAAVSGRLVLSDFTKKFITQFKNKA
jgi:methylglutaconyl-CoA hydratase